LACNTVGGGYFDTGTGVNKNDPTNGANYYHTCNLVNSHTKNMECSVRAGICEKITTGKCANCRHCFYKCKSMPKRCKDLFPKPDDQAYLDVDDGNDEYYESSGYS
jgi:hypothetical protein